MCVDLELMEVDGDCNLAPGLIEGFADIQWLIEFDDRRHPVVTGYRTHFVAFSNSTLHGLRLQFMTKSSTRRAPYIGMVLQEHVNSILWGSCLDVSHDVLGVGFPIRSFREP